MVLARLGYKEKDVNPHLIVLEAVESPENNKRGPRLRRWPCTLLSVLIENFHVSKTEIKASSFNMLKNRKSI